MVRRPPNEKDRPSRSIEADAAVVGISQHDIAALGRTSELTPISGLGPWIRKAAALELTYLGDISFRHASMMYMMQHSSYRASIGRSYQPILSLDCLVAGLSARIAAIIDGFHTLRESLRLSSTL